MMLMLLMLMIVMMLMLFMLMVVMMLMLLMLMIVVMFMLLMFMVVMMFMVMMMTADGAYIILSFCQHLIRQRYGILHCAKDLCSGQFIPGSRHERCIRVFLTDQCSRCVKFFLADLLCSAQDYTPCAFNLIVIELPKVLHVHFYFCGVSYSH